MDYDWKYYIDDLKAGNSGVIITEDDRLAAGHIMDRLPAERLKNAERIVRNMLFDYRQQGKAGNALIDDVMKQHTIYCKAYPDDELLHRRHNAIVYRYMIKTALHNRAVAAKLNISNNSLAGDMKQAKGELLTILFGLPAVIGDADNWPGAVRQVFENMRLLSCCLSVNSRIPYQEWEAERIRCVGITSGILRITEKAVQMYGEYCSRCLTTKDTAERSLETIRALYLDDVGRNVEETAELQGVSPETIYSDIRRAMERFAVLFEYMAGGRLPEDGA